MANWTCYAHKFRASISSMKANSENSTATAAAEAKIDKVDMLIIDKASYHLRYHYIIVTLSLKYCYNVAIVSLKYF